MAKLNNLKRCHKCHVVERYVRNAEGDCEPPGIPVELSQGVWQLLWRRLQYWDRSGFSTRGEWMWLCVGHILCRTGSLDTLKVWKHVFVPANICLWRKWVQAEHIKDSSVMSPSRLNQLPEKQWLTRRFTQLRVPKPPYAEQNKLLFVYYRGVNMHLWNGNRQSLFGYTGFVIYSNLNRLFWLAK